MNIKKTYLARLFAVALCASVLLSCNTDETDNLQAETRNGLCFSISQISTRLVHNFEETTFEDGEAIGCVIAEVGTDGTTFGCNTKWTYRKDGGMLLLAADNAYVKVKTSEEPEFLELVDNSKTLRFFFYYPYVDDDLLASDGDYPSYNNVTFSETPTGSNWQAYPCFVNITQGSNDGEGNYKDPRLCKSDFLYAQSSEITSASTYRINLTFQKKTATVLVHSEAKLDDINFEANDDKILIRGKKIDLSTGVLSDYDDDLTTSPGQYKYFKEADEIGPNYQDYNTTENVYYYRIVLPAQTDCDFSMKVKFNKDDKFKTINLNAAGLTELAEGKIYSIHLSKAGNTVVTIDPWTANSTEYNLE